MPDNPNLIEINNLSVFFKGENGHHKAVQDVNLKLKKGETVGIVGESGSGKTVTSLSMMRLLPRAPYCTTEGEILFNSRQYGEVDILKMPFNQLRHLRGNEISMIFQEPMTSLNPAFTCGNQVIESILRHEEINPKTAKERVIKLFEKVHLSNPERIYNAYPHEISGGQKQRVMIAMALACNPLLLIADEPTTALDVTVQAAILEILRELRETEDMSVVFITHDLGVVAEFADRIIVMYQGKIVEEGAVWDIFSNPQHPYTKGLLACRPRLDLKLRVLPVVSDFMATDEHGNISEITEAKFQSVGQALMLNFQSEAELRKHHERLVKQTPLLQIKSLTKEFVKTKGFFSNKKEIVRAVNDVSFDVYPGEILGLVGESGCGKSTLGRSLLRLVEPTSGEVIFEGKNVLGLNPKEMRAIRKDMQIIFQDPYGSLNPRMTIGEIIMEPMRIHSIMSNDKERRAYVIELLETVNLNAYHFNRYPHEFSGGQRQRICIARALALQPKFIICDESVSALDVSVQAQVLNLLNELKEKFNLTYIFISHDLAVVKFIADRILVMKDGQIVETGFSEDIYDKPKRTYTRELIKAIPRGDLDTIRRIMLKRKLQKSS